MLTDRPVHEPPAQSGSPKVEVPMSVVTRFAPSPTGFLHIGGARTALFNWLYARKTGGTMLLRIEDTDRQRSTREAIDAIIDGMDWLGLRWDGEVVYQFARAARHAEIARAMLDAGTAYRCFATPEELETMRETAIAQGRPPRYDGRWRDRDPAEAPAGAPFAIRLKARQDGETVIEDLVQGRVAFPNKDLDDLVLLRSDGTPTYMHAVVVDDHDMGVTHVVRGVDHLTNAARQTQIYEANGWAVPSFSHIPLIHGADGAKLSKRHGALGVDAYRAMGYLPAALRNYLARLSWSHGDQELFSTEEMIQLFTLEAVGKSAARFDMAKLDSVNGHYMRTLPEAEVLASLDAALPHLPGGPAFAARLDGPARARLARAMPGLRERAKTLVELVENARFLVERLDPDDKARRILDEGGRERLAAIRPLLAGAPTFAASALEDSVKAWAETSGTKLGQIAQPLRAALTGRTTSPPIFDVLEVLGQGETLARLDSHAACALGEATAGRGAPPSDPAPDIPKRQAAPAPRRVASRRTAVTAR